MQLSPSQEQVLALIYAGSTLSQAAQSAVVHRNTIYNWFRSALPFRFALARAREAKAHYWREQAEECAQTAIDTIRAIMTDPNALAGVRLKAAQSILALATTPPLEPPAPSFSEIADSVHNSAQSIPQAPSEPQLPAAAPAPESAIAEPVHNSAQPFRRTAAKVGRNDVCPCGSGKKFKHCC